MLALFSGLRMGQALKNSGSAALPVILLKGELLKQH
jgi:hypothetical protein